MEQTQSRFKAFLARKNVNITVKTYLIDALGAMAFGLFASLLIGTIFATLGEKSGIEIFTTISDYAKSATGAALGVSIAYALKHHSWYCSQQPLSVLPEMPLADRLALW